ncbi:AMP-dependent synthetase/ligase [Fulvivirga sediminis]|uniref:Long-chain fatty acid--CoA ligase n=1 Tax=Fulvivirga sediminis TaxID=2803949 RepID=A0A937JY26_9BACT|nr:long-chain fatty acid--CoA ligase [Fulvivirga sediminis]MBL3655239.1 long-chain fatty acid--CoA ligase [Fulvivirga sediminis]
MKYDIDQLNLIPQIPRWQLSEYPQDVMLAKRRQDKWIYHSTEQVVDKINRISAGLLGLGVKQDDKIAIISGNCPEWNFIDYGVQQIGAVTVPLYAKMSTDEIQYILNDAEVKIVFTDNEAVIEKISRLKISSNTTLPVYLLEDYHKHSYIKLLKEYTVEVENEIASRMQRVQENDTATIVYTSGTTGQPKGVMLSHKNILSNVKACLSLMPVTTEHNALSFLPLNHVFERMLNYLYMAAGISIYYAEKVDTIARDIKDIKPHIFTTVPRLLEKVYEKIVDKGKEQKGIKRIIFFWALRLAQRYDFTGKSWWYNQQLSWANKFVFNQWRDALGCNIVAIISGGAALNEKVNRVFNASGISVMEGYGLTETSPVIAVNRFEQDQRKIGTVGPPLDNVEVKIAEDGEILCKGPSVMKGYYKQEEKTAEVLKEGWFYTEDIGELNDGFLKITDRKKSIFKTSGGKYVAPQSIEKVLKESHLVGQMMVVGEGRKMVTALIVPDFDNLKNWCEKNNIKFDSKEKAIKSDEVIARFNEMIDRKNQKLNHTEQIKDFRLLAEEWSENRGELTPTLKVKRAVVEKNYKDLIDSMYAEVSRNHKKESTKREAEQS